MEDEIKQYRALAVQRFMNGESLHIARQVKVLAGSLRFLFESFPVSGTAAHPSPWLS